MYGIQQTTIVIKQTMAPKTIFSWHSRIVEIVYEIPSNTSS